MWWDLQLNEIFFVCVWRQYPFSDCWDPLEQAGLFFRSFILAQPVWLSDWVLTCGSGHGLLPSQCICRGFWTQSPIVGHTGGGRYMMFCSPQCFDVSMLNTVEKFTLKKTESNHLWWTSLVLRFYCFILLTGLTSTIFCIFYFNYFSLCLFFPFVLSNGSIFRYTIVLLLCWHYTFYLYSCNSYLKNLVYLFCFSSILINSWVISSDPAPSTFSYLFYYTYVCQAYSSHLPSLSHFISLVICHHFLSLFKLPYFPGSTTWLSDSLSCVTFSGYC